MSVGVDYLLDTASEAEIAAHLVRCDADFVPPLSGRVAIQDYARKIASTALRFEAWSGGSLIALVAAYCNDRNKCIAYITSVSVLRAWTGKGIGASLVGQCIERAKESGMQLVSLEVAEANIRAIKLYSKRGFVVGNANGPFVAMNLYLTSREEHEQHT